MKTVLDNLPVPLRVVDMENGNILYVNDSLLDLLEYDLPEELCGRQVECIMPPTLRDGTTAGERRSMVNAMADHASMETEYRTKTGRIIEAMVTVCAIDYNGQSASLGIIKDLTAEKERARILLEAAEREKEANQAKSLFLANMSHEIRTPMNGIIGMTDLLINENLTERQHQYVKDIKVSAESLLEIINDILDLSKITEGRLQIIPVNIDLSMLLKNIISMMSFTARSKGLDFIDDISINTPEYILADDVRLKQIIVNLLSNSIKFTRKGQVKLHVRIENGCIVFEISDTGIGIKPDDLDQIFAPFEQADTKRNRAIKGTGLGLSISKSLVETMGGKIWVESQYGVGTTFFVTIPHTPGSEVAAETIDTLFEYISAPLARVLIVDDIQTNLTVGSGLLRLCDISADVAISGFEAIELVKAKDYDLVFMDHMMPEMDGVETTRQIRGLGGKYKELPIIALTANAVSEAKTLLLNSDMNDFLPKPIDKGDLMILLKKWLPPHKIELGEKSAETGFARPYSEAIALASKIPGLNVEIALNRIGGEQEFLEESLKQAIDTLGGQIKKLDAFLAAHDLRGFAIEAHGMKSVLAGIGAMGHAERAADLEIAAKAENRLFCVEKFPLFADTIECFVAELRSIFSGEKPPCRCPGDILLLNRKIPEIVELLKAYDYDNSLCCLEQLCNFTFSQEKDAALENAMKALKDFDYDKTLLLLTKLPKESQEV